MKAIAIATLAAAAAAGALLAPAAVRGQTGPAGERIVRVTVFGSDPCPQGRAGEIIICGRRPGQERFRIPEALRDDATADDPENVSWAARAQSLEYVGRAGIQSCSPVGAGGSTGCIVELIRTARGERARGEGQPGR
ncbi:MAG TPA: hypothetical protein VEZ70_15340 [Allosphingosinicella sp.]|nr:hypothetical protein [Allosphingosinicella sp.]